MKRLALIIAILMAAGNFSACSQTERRTETTPTAATTATASTVSATESKSSVTESETEPQGTEPTLTVSEQTVKSPSIPHPTEANKIDGGQTPKKQDEAPQATLSPKSEPNPAEQTQPKQQPAEASKPKPTEAPKPKPTEPPAPKEEINYNQVVSNLIAYGQQLGMVYNGSLGLGNGWFPPTDISGYTDTGAATAACYGDVEYVISYYSGLGAEPADIMFNVIASDGQIYVVYA